MSRSLKRSIHQRISEKKILAMNESVRRMLLNMGQSFNDILPDFVGHTVAVHNGNKFIPVYVTENMVGTQAWRVCSNTSFRSLW